MEGFLPTAAICLVLLLIVVFSVRSYLKKLKSGCCGAGGDEVKAGFAPPTGTPLTTAMPGWCGLRACTARTAPAASKMPSTAKRASTPRWTWPKKTALVRTKAPVSDQQLKQVVRGLGYSPVAVEPA